MPSIDFNEIEANPIALLDAINRGEYLFILKDGRSIAELTPVPNRKGPRKLGAYKGEMWISEDFDAPMEIVDAVERR